MTLRLSGDTSGFTEIKAADAAGDNSIKLPAANGSANQLLQNGGTAGELQYTSAGSGLHYDASGRLLLGTSTARTDFYGSLASDLQVQGTSFSALSTHTTAGNGAIILSRGTIINGSTVGNLSWQGDDGSTLVEAASITGRIEGAPGASVMPGKILFSTNAGGAGTTPRMEIGSNGALKLLAGCPGIDFSAIQPAAIAGTMTSETLDSYEEGLFEPSASGASSAGTTGYSLRFGAYVKIGKICHFQIRLQVTSMTGVGSLIIGGLPFTSMNDAERGYASINVTYYSALTAAAGVTHIGAYTERNATHMVLVGNTVGSVVTTPQVDTNFVMLCGGTYRTDS